MDPCGLALADEQGIVASMSFRHEREVSRWWADRLRWMLEKVTWRLDQLEGLAVCNGPGSFTGLRIGVTAMKTLAQALERPLLGVSSLELVALPYHSAWPGTIFSVLYCRKGEVYRAAHSEEGIVKAPEVRTVEEVNRELAETSAPLLVCGSAGPKDSLILPPGARWGDAWLARPHVERLALEGHARLSQGQGGDPMGLTVQYLKRSQAEEQAELYRKMSN